MIDTDPASATYNMVIDTIPLGIAAGLQTLIGIAITPDGTRAYAADRNEGLLVIDTNPDQGQFGKMARQIYPEIYTPTYVEERADFYREHGFERFEVDTVIRAPNRDVLGDILKLDFADRYEEVLSSAEGNEISYSLSVYHFKE